MIAVAPVDYHDPAAFPTAKALAADICASHTAGAAVVHIHVTDATGRASADTTFFDEVVARVHDQCDILIEGSTGGVGVPWEVRAAALSAHEIELASLNMGTCNLFGRAYENTPGEIAALAKRMRTAGVIPDMCFFEPGFFTSLELLEPPRAMPAKPPPLAGICLGFPGALPASVENLVFMVSKLPPGAVWTLVHHGYRDCALLAAAVAAGATTPNSCVTPAGFSNNSAASPRPQRKCGKPSASAPGRAGVGSPDTFPAFSHAYLRHDPHGELVSKGGH